MSGRNESHPDGAGRPWACLCVGAAHLDVLARSVQAFTTGADLPGTVTRRAGGVALNVACGLAAHGLDATLVAAIGEDAAGDDLVSKLRRTRVNGAGILRTAGRTDTYVALETGAGELHAAVADCALLEANCPALVNRLEALLSELAGDGAPTLVFVDGNLPEDCVGRILDAAPEWARVAFAVASPAKAARTLRLVGDPRGVIFLNRAEAEAVCGRALPDAVAASQALRALGFQEVIVTDGRNEAACSGAEGTVARRPRPAQVAGVTGAGDALVAAYIAARAGGVDAARALEVALDAAADHVSGRLS